jgi:hypothetical protein
MGAQMNRHDYSPNYRPSAHKNRVTDNRHPSDRENDDNEQMAYLVQWKIDHPDDNLRGLLFLLIVAIAMLAATLTYIRRVQPVIAVMKPCQVCHAPEDVVYKTLGQYQRGLKAKRALGDKNILADLVANP